jgi:diacylglycerol kinase family enzyme
VQWRVPQAGPSDPTLVHVNDVPVFCNVTAGQGARAERRLAEINPTGDLTFRFVAVPPESWGETVAAEVARGTPIIGVSGGDGSVSVAAQQLRGTDVRLAVFPGGTLNHFSVALGLHSFQETARAVALGRSTLVDVGEVNGRVFVNGVSLGLYPRQLRLREVWQPRIRKWPAAALATALSLAGIDSHVLEIEGPEMRRMAVTPLVWVGPAKGSFHDPRRRPRALTTDTLELVVVSATSSRRLIQLGWRAIRSRGDGLRVCASERDCTIHHLPEFTVHTWTREALDVGLDGELLSMEGPLHFRVLPRALHVFHGERPQRKADGGI